MKVVFYEETFDTSTPIGDVTLDGDEVKVDPELTSILDGHFVTDDGRTQLTELDGARYLRALPTAFRGPYLHAALEE